MLKRSLVHSMPRDPNDPFKPTYSSGERFRQSEQASEEYFDAIRPRRPADEPSSARPSADESSVQAESIRREDVDGAAEGEQAHASSVSDWRRISSLGIDLVNLQTRILEACEPTDALDECFAGLLTFCACATFATRKTDQDLEGATAPKDDKHRADPAKLFEAVQSGAIHWLSRSDEARMQELEKRLAEVQGGLTTAKLPQGKRAPARRPGKKSKGGNGPLK
jgi:hypothetical protein